MTLHHQCLFLVISALLKAGIHFFEQIKSYFGVGEIYKQGKNAYQSQVNYLKDLTAVILPHFLMYPLITQKRADFELFNLWQYI